MFDNAIRHARLVPVTLCAAAWLLVSGFPAPTVLAQPTGPLDLREEDPERRRIQQLLVELRELPPEKTSEAADAFDTAWALAVVREDPVLNLKTELQQSLQPGQSQVDAGARAQLYHYYEQSTPGFRRAYQQQIGNTARDALAAVSTSAGLGELERVIQRYQFTDAGHEALEQLVRLRISRGEYLQAALVEGQRLKVRGNPTADEQTQLALLWWKAGLPKDAVALLEEIVQQFSGQAVNVFGHPETLPDQKTAVGEWLPATSGDDVTSTDTAQEWTQSFGDYRRSQAQPHGPAELQTAWSASAFTCAVDGAMNALLEAAAVGLENEVDVGRERNNTVIPVASPLLVGDLLIYRAIGNLRAVDRRSGALRWETSFIDRQLKAALDDAQTENDPDTGLVPFVPDELEAADDLSDNMASVVTRRLRPQLLNHWLRANTGGQLTCDGQTIFAVEEVTAETMSLATDRQLLANRSETPVNYLRAYDVKGGGLRGIAGGGVGLSGGGQANPLAGMYFLGAPMVMGDRIYVIAESDQGIFLLQLKTTPLFQDPDQELDLRPVASQLLSIPRHPLRTHPVRRLAGIVPAFGRGLLICCTCDEQVVAVSAEDHSVRWIYRYPTNVGSPEMNPGIVVVGTAFSVSMSDRVDMANRWTDCLPRIIGNRILVTPRDSDRLLCLDLQSGQELWSHPRGPLRSISAVTDEAVVLTGGVSVVCLNPADGRPLWETELESGRISGTAVSDGQVVQIPTSEPSVVTLDLKTGRQLIRQETSETPGNLLSDGDHLYAQSVSQVLCLSPADDSSGKQLNAAVNHLLDANIAAAETALQQVIDNESLPAPERTRAKQVLIETWLESLRADYTGGSDRIPQLKALIESVSLPEQRIAETLHSMLGMTLIDAARLAPQWQQISRSRRQLETLQALIARGELRNPDNPADVAASRIFALLTQAYEARTDWVTSAGHSMQSSRQAVAELRAALELRMPDSAAEIRRLLEVQLATRMSSAKPDEAIWWAQVSLLADLPLAVSEAARGDQTLPPTVQNALHELALMLLTESSDPQQALTSATELLTFWHDRSSGMTLQGLHRNLRQRDAFLKRPLAETASTVSLRKDGLLPPELVDQLPEHLRKPASELLPESPWHGQPEVTESPARTAQAGGVFDHRGAIQNDLPLFESSGCYAGWHFLRTMDGELAVQAYDAFGRPRWTFDPGRSLTRFPRGFDHLSRRVGSQYVLACGNLLAIKLHHLLYVIDPGQADRQTPPTLLWETDLSAAGLRFSDAQLNTRGWETTNQYDEQPSGLFPVGPLTPYGIPVYSGQSLQLLNVLTGQPEWHVSGLPTDCTMTVHKDRLLLMSESAGQVETRSLIDGSVISSASLPDWWTEASENSNASVRYFDPEPGDRLHWRICVRDGACLLLVRSLQGSSLELVDLQTQTARWKVELPADSLVSNYCDGHVAVLSDSNQLQLFDTVSGLRVADHRIPDSPDCLYLYLRASGGQWLVLTDCYDADHDEQNPAGESVIVNGHVVAISQQDGSLSWTHPIQHQWLRMLHPESSPRVHSPVAPLLLLLKRPWPNQVGANGLRVGPVLYQAQVLDVRTGKVVYEDQDVGQSLSFLWMKLQPDQHQIELSFDKRVVTFDYSPKKSP
ncbi:MAG: PQQ-binding-like beta-propeller repeat protein [Planctomycetaceae bacterium]